MEALLCVLALVAGLVLIAAAFVYLVDSGQGQWLLQHLRTLLMAGVGLIVVLAIMRNADFSSVVASLIAISVVSYFIHEYRGLERSKPQSLGGAERKPVLPSRESREKEREQE